MKRALVVGAGFAGAVVARELAEAGWKVVVIDKRNHVGGNAYDFVNSYGHRVHKYGPHLWHGSSDLAHDWVSQFTEWVPYKHWVHAQLNDGQHVPLPINKLTIETVFKKEIQERWGPTYTDENLKQLMEEKRVKFDAVTNSRQHVESSVGKELCELFFAPYTKKMWGMDLSDLPTSVASRIPTKDDYDPFYFPKDKHQYLPKNGYTALFEKIFKHPNILVSLRTARQELPQYAHGDRVMGPSKNWTDEQIANWDKPYDAVFSSEPIDTYYNCDLGELPWRSVKMHTYSVPVPSMLSAPVVNFTHTGPFTRVTEWKQLPNQEDRYYSREIYNSTYNWTTVTVEEPCDYKDNDNERYYPVKTSLAVDPNRELYKLYRDRAKGDFIHFIGRCGRYVYTDMMPCVNSTLTQVRKFLAGDTIPSED